MPRWSMARFTCTRQNITLRPNLVTQSPESGSDKRAMLNLGAGDMGMAFNDLRASPTWQAGHAWHAEHPSPSSPLPLHRSSSYLQNISRQALQAEVSLQYTAVCVFQCVLYFNLQVGAACKATRVKVRARQHRCFWSDSRGLQRRSPESEQAVAPRAVSRPNRLESSSSMSEDQRRSTVYSTMFRHSGCSRVVAQHIIMICMWLLACRTGQSRNNTTSGLTVSADRCASSVAAPAAPACAKICRTHCRAATQAHQPRLEDASGSRARAEQLPFRQRPRALK